MLLVNRVLAYRGVLAGSWVLFLRQLPDLLEFCDHVEALLFSLELGLSGEVHLELEGPSLLRVHGLQLWGLVGVVV